LILGGIEEKLSSDDRIEFLGDMPSEDLPGKVVDNSV
jgi:hypothetical protein